MITVLRPGMLTTIQDRGRWGWQHRGIPPAGPMDGFSFRVANALAGNDDWAPALEITLIGPQLRAERDLTVAIAGADLSASVPLGRPTRIERGAVLRFGMRKTLTRAYLAVSGGIEVPAVLGSRAASLSARLPGLAGRALRAGDVLEVGGEKGDARGRHEFIPEMGLIRGSHARLRYLWGPDRDRFSDETARAFVAAEYALSTDSNRMGYRLHGPALQVIGGGDVLSEASPMGSIQVPSSGQPILLMADRQTTGGYARIGTVITADLATAGQLGPGDTVRFEPCDRETAVNALREQEEILQRLRSHP